MQKENIFKRMWMNTFLRVFFKIVINAFVLLAVVGILQVVSSPERLTMNKKSNDTSFARIEANNGTYIGEIESSRLMGSGQFNFNDGIKYFGSWVDSQMNGDGTCTFPEIGVYTGEFDNGKRSGQGTFIWDSGETYLGEWKNDLPVNGVYTFTDGSTYTGTINNKKLDNGIFVLNILPETGELLSEEEIKQSSEEDTNQVLTELQITYSNGIQSEIIYRTNDGYNYVGSILNTGNAEIDYVNGDNYTGEVSHGQRQGEGLYKWIGDEGLYCEHYEGSWSNDLMNGQGTYYYSSGAYPYLSGQWKDGLPDGACKYYEESGNTFTCTFEEGKCISIE